MEGVELRYEIVLKRNMRRKKVSLGLILIFKFFDEFSDISM